jgi:hypothetical protein
MRTTAVGRWRAPAVLLAVAVLAFGAAACGGGGGGAARSSAAGSGNGRLDTSRAAITAALHLLASGTPGSNRTVTVPGCPEPTLPPVQLPDGSHGLEVPFVAELTNGYLNSGWDIQAHDQGAADPFRAVIGPIVGWVTGMLDVPQLTSSAQPDQVVICDASNQVPIHASLASGSASTDPIQNYCPSPDPSFATCSPYHVAYIDFIVTINIVKPAALSVSGVEPDGALALVGSAAASTTVTVPATVAGGTTQVCTQASPGYTTIGISTAVTPEPASGPVGAAQLYKPSPLTGPLSSADATLVSNSFAVPAFLTQGTPPTPKKPQPYYCDFGSVLNETLGGFNKSGHNIYNYQNPAKHPVASPVGWSQFEVTASIVRLGIPVGPPAGFNF